MKKTLLLLCAIPCLLTAQTSIKKESGEKQFLQQLMKNQQTGASLANLPDTIHTYRGEGKDFWYTEEITYDENGRRKLVNRIADSNADGIITDEEMTKIAYTYQFKNDTLEIQEISSVFREEWIDVSKTVSIQKSPGIYLEYTTYGYINDCLVLSIKAVAAEFNEIGLPVLYNLFSSEDMTIDSDLFLYLYNEITYDEKNRYNTFTYFAPIQDELDSLLISKTEFKYNGNEKLEKMINYDYDNEEWHYNYLIEFAYDEKGNLFSEIEKSESGVEEAFYYTNIYPSTVSNEEIFSIESSICPNPVSDILNVTIEGTDEAIITLISANGSIVTQQKVQESVASIPVSLLAKGLYFLKVQTTHGAKTHKVIIK